MSATFRKVESSEAFQIIEADVIPPDTITRIASGPFTIRYTRTANYWIVSFPSIQGVLTKVGGVNSIIYPDVIPEIVMDDIISDTNGDALTSISQGFLVGLSNAADPVANADSGYKAMYLSIFDSKLGFSPVAMSADIGVNSSPLTDVINDGQQFAIMGCDFVFLAPHIRIEGNWYYSDVDLNIVLNEPAKITRTLEECAVNSKDTEFDGSSYTWNTSIVQNQVWISIPYINSKLTAVGGENSFGFENVIPAGVYVPPTPIMITGGIGVIASDEDNHRTLDIFFEESTAEIAEDTVITIYHHTIPGYLTSKVGEIEENLIKGTMTLSNGASLDEGSLSYESHVSPSNMSTAIDGYSLITDGTAASGILNNFSKALVPHNLDLSAFNAAFRTRKTWQWCGIVCGNSDGVAVGPMRISISKDGTLFIDSDFRLDETFGNGGGPIVEKHFVNGTRENWLKVVP